MEVESITQNLMHTEKWTAIHWIIRQEQWLKGKTVQVKSKKNNRLVRYLIIKRHRFNSTWELTLDYKSGKKTNSVRIMALLAQKQTDNYLSSNSVWRIDTCLLSLWLIQDLRLSFSSVELMIKIEFLLFLIMDWAISTNNRTESMLDNKFANHMKNLNS